MVKTPYVSSRNALPGIGTALEQTVKCVDERNELVSVWRGS